jgi:hypothetical protein
MPAGPPVRWRGDQPPLRWLHGLTVISEATGGRRDHGRRPRHEAVDRMDPPGPRRRGTRGMALAFMTRGIAVRWLQTEAVRQAQRKYGPEVRTSVGRCTDTRILCNYPARRAPGDGTIDDPRGADEQRGQGTARMTESGPALLLRRVPRASVGLTSSSTTLGMRTWRPSRRVTTLIFVDSSRPTSGACTTCQRR